MALRSLLGSLIVGSLVSGGLVVADEVKNAPRTEQAAKADAPRVERALAAKFQADAEYFDTQLGDVVADLEQAHGIDIVLDTAALTADGKGPETIINLQRKGLTLPAALTQIVQQHGLTWTVADELIVITAPAAEINYPVTKVYSVADFADADGKVDYDELATLIKQAVAPKSWEETPRQQILGESTGQGAVIARVSARKAFVITQTYRNHQAIAAILKQLRAE